MPSGLIGSSRIRPRGFLPMEISVDVSLTRSAVLLAIICGTSGCVSRPACDFDVLNHQPHSGSAQKFEVELLRRLESDGRVGGPGIKVNLIASQIERSADGKTGDRFYYVVADGQNRFVAAETCSDGVGDCVAKAADLARSACKNPQE